MLSEGKRWWSKYPVGRVLFVVVSYGVLAIRHQLRWPRVNELFLVGLVALAILSAGPLAAVGVRLSRREAGPLDYLLVAILGVVTLLIAAAVKSAYA